MCVDHDFVLRNGVLDRAAEAEAEAKARAEEAAAALAVAQIAYKKAAEDALAAAVAGAFAVDSIAPHDITVTSGPNEDDIFTHVYNHLPHTHTHTKLTNKSSHFVRSRSRSRGG